MMYTSPYGLCSNCSQENAHNLARRHLNKASVPQKRNYNKRLAGRLFVIGDSVWLHNVRRKKGKNAKLDCPSERPYVVISVLSEVVYRIRKRRKAQLKVDHSDRLKPYLGPPLERWIPKRQTQLSSPRRGERETLGVYSSVCRRRTVSSVEEREGVELDETQSTELKNTRAVFPREIGMLIELGMITVLSPPNNVREPEPRAELPTSVVDDLNWDGVRWPSNS